MQKKILIVEDNDNNMLLMRCILESSGLQVIEAKTGLEGIQQAHKNEADLIIMDIHLPDFSGINVTKKIREFNKDVPIVAHASPIDVAGKVVAGVLPMRLAALATCLVELQLNLPASARNRELDFEDVRAYAGDPVKYTIQGEVIRWQA